MTTNAFILVWDCYGLESAIPITQYENFEKEKVWATLKGEEPEKSPFGTILNSVIMRARFNPQRNYEVYAIDCARSFTADGWHKFFNDTPQTAANLVRERGHKIYCNREDVTKRVIT